MTAAQSIKNCELLNKHFNSIADATEFITEYKVDKVAGKTMHLATKQDLSEAKVDIIK